LDGVLRMHADERAASWTCLANDTADSMKWLAPIATS
jgi:hypothetical protein